MSKLKLIIVTLILGALPILGNAQTNFVLNGGFEQYSFCPFGYDQIRYANCWQPIDTVNIVGYGPVCSPEYCNKCSNPGSLVGVPLGSLYYHYPRTGNGMVKIESYFDNNYPEHYQRDYAQGKLYDNLVSGKNYCITFYVTLAQGSQYAINKIGAYLDNGAIDAGQDSVGCASPHPTIIPQVYTTSIIDDTTNWVKIQGSFIATGSERFITIGNFFDADNTDTVRQHPHTANNYSWYLIDDVSVIESTATAFAGPDALIGLGDTIHIGSTEEGMPCEWYILGSTTPIGYGGGIDVHPTTTTSYIVMLDLCGHVTYDTVKIYVVPAGVSSLGFPADLIKIYPSPASNQLHIDQAANCSITIMDITGHTVLQNTLLTEKEALDITALPQGTYMTSLTDNKTGIRIVKRFTKE